jgi:hypothetical protein
MKNGFRIVEMLSILIEFDIAVKTNLDLINIYSLFQE